MVALTSSSFKGSLPLTKSPSAHDRLGRRRQIAALICTHDCCWMLFWKPAPFCTALMVGPRLAPGLRRQSIRGRVDVIAVLREIAVGGVGRDIDRHRSHVGGGRSSSRIRTFQDWVGAHCRRPAYARYTRAADWRRKPIWRSPAAPGRRRRTSTACDCRWVRMCRPRSSHRRPGARSVRIPSASVWRRQ